MPVAMSADPLEPNPASAPLRPFGESPIPIRRGGFAGHPPEVAALGPTRGARGGPKDTCHIPGEAILSAGSRRRDVEWPACKPASVNPGCVTQQVR